MLQVNRLIAPPLIISADQVGEILHWLDLALAETTSDLLGADGVVSLYAVSEKIFDNPYEQRTHQFLTEFLPRSLND
jgi:hypothetical protein